MTKWGAERSIHVHTASKEESAVRGAWCVVRGAVVRWCGGAWCGRRAVLNDASLTEQSARPRITGRSDRLTRAEVTSPSMRRAKMTVKKGAEDLMVSVKDTATYLAQQCCGGGGGYGPG